MIIAKKVQQPVQGKHPKLGAKTMPGRSRLAPCNVQRNHDIAELAGLIGGKRQDVGGNVFVTIATIQLPHAMVRSYRNRDSTPRAGGRNPL